MPPPRANVRPTAIRMMALRVSRDAANTLISVVPRQFGVLIFLMSSHKTTLVTPQILTTQADGAGNQRYLIYSEGL